MRPGLGQEHVGALGRFFAGGLGRGAPGKDGAAFAAESVPRGEHSGLRIISPLPSILLSPKLTPSDCKAATGDKATTTWSEQRHGFVIALPKKQIYQPTELVPLFRGDLLGSFDEKKPSQIPLRAGGAAADDWADVEMDSATGNPAVVEQPRRTSLNSAPRGVADFLPTVASLPRPDELLLRPPYHLSLLSGGSQELELECSHSPTLQFLADYFKRWCRVNHHDTRSVRAPVARRRDPTRATVFILN